LRFAEPDNSRNLFLDVLFLALLGFVVVTILLLFHVNPPKVGEEDAKPPGSVIFEMRWPDEHCADIDMWVMGPDMTAVGYSNRESELSNLLRDDLGFHRALSDLNYESVYTRGILPGEYQANVHFFSSHGCPPPVQIWVSASVRRPDHKTYRLIETQVTLTHQGQEITAFRFKLTESGGPVLGSFHDIPRGLRSRRP
jgi:hypothetical protein